MDAVNTIARLIKIKASNFGFAGTKDRRAGTVQRISVYRQKASNLIWLNTRIPNVKVGDFEYSKEPLQLGQHGGNEFVITLKNCQPLGGDACSLPQRMQMIQQAVECGLAYLKHNGYINYYGLQRFGTYSIGTHLLGMKILKGDYEGFIDDVLHVDDDLIKEVLSNAPPAYGVGKDFQNSRDDHNRARAITTWKTTKNAAKALEFLPKRFSSETAIIRHLGKNPKDFTGAVLSITRGMRMMYVHAYQSYVWNFVATRRWSKYGPKVIEGDLVLVTGSRRRDNQMEDEFNPYDDNDDDNIYAQAHALSAAEAASGKYTIFDVVLPTPGWDVSYPRNEIGEFYVEFMGKPENGALSPFEMRRKQREFSLSGNYRALIGRLIGSPEYAIRAYCDDTEQMYPTDLDYALHKKRADKLAKAAAATPPVNPAANPAADPIVNRWAHFAKNPEAYDNAMAAERRRKAEEEPQPASDVVTVTNETWVQTGIDGSAKRVKLARHRQQIENHKDKDKDPFVSEVAPAAPALEAEKPKEDANRTPSPVVDNGVSIYDYGFFTSPPPVIFNDGPFPMVPLPENYIRPIGQRGLSESYYMSIGRVPYRGPLPPGFKMEPDFDGPFCSDAPIVRAAPAVVATPDPPQPIAKEVKAKSSDAMDWYGANLPKVPSVVVPPKESQADGADPVPATTAEASSGSSDAEVINNIAIPKLRTALDNPLSAMAMSATVGEDTVDPNADKIAVILKFQLKASNYATIVLRELMGTTAEGLAL